MYIVLILALVGGEFLIKTTFTDKVFCRRFQCIYGALLLFLFAGLHGDTVGIDVPSYFSDFKHDAMMSFNEILNAKEGTVQARDTFFHLFLHLLSFISKDPQIMLLSIGAIVAIGYSVMMYLYCDDILIGYIMFICLRMYSFTCSGLRQAIAMSFLWISTKYIIEKKPVKFLIFVIIASLFHASAFIFVFAYFLARIRRPFVLAYISIFFFIACYVTNYLPLHLLTKLPFLSRFENYLSSGHATESGISTLLVYLVIMVYAVFINQKLMNGYKTEKEEMTVLLEYNLAVIGLMLSFIGFQFADLFRIGYYFIVYLYMLFPKVLDSFEDKPTRIVLRFAAVALLVAQYIIKGPSAGIENYVFFWQS